ncbi:MAG: magnesium/cobalt transporter CorA [Gammaproteobacteria bacterium]
MRALLINKKIDSAEVIENESDYCIPQSDEEYIWVDFQSIEKQKEQELLENNFSISSLSVNDAYRLRHPPKYEKYSNYSFILIKAFDSETEGMDFNILHISFFISKKFLITVHACDSPSINTVWKNISNDASRNEPYSLAYKIIKTIISRYTKVILNLENRLEEIESEMLDRPNDNLLSELIRYNSKTQYLMRIFTNQHSVMEEMAKQETLLSKGDLRHQYKDLEEHMARLSGLSALLNSVIKNLMDGYISVSSHRLNNIMKILTIVAAIFLPLTFLAGIYGMNFEYMPELSFKYGYFIMLTTMAVLAVGLLALFRKLKWI